ncbi:MAG: leucine-rich repeat protein [Clostridia bacterium]|nr:leucine-rich repeat protein [Clostridia bacterium]
MIGENLRIWGWVGSLSEIQGFGYSINDGEIITGEFAVDPEEDVVNAAHDSGASFASRFAILVPVNDGAYTIKAYMITETTEEVIWVIHVTVVGQFSYDDNGDGTCTITGRGTHTEADLVIPFAIDGLVVTAIGENAFAGCEGLTSVTFSEMVSVIAENAFEGCTSLTDVFYGGDADQWANIAIADGNDALAAAEIHYGSLTGTPIGSAENFLRMDDPAGEYYLTDDIYLTESYGVFSGTFNGNGHTVTVENCAVFDTLSGATVKNLIIEGSIERNGNTGGLANQGNNVTVINVTNNANIISSMASKSYYIGGIIGAVLQGDGSADSREYSYFIDCANNGTITASSTTGIPRVGGITGNAAKYQWCVYENCVNNGRLEATASNVSRCPYVGGIAGSAFGGEFTDCVNNGELVSENSAYIGGILSRATPSNQGGDQSVTCTNCINNGTLSCAMGDGNYSENTGIGGIIGFAGAERKETESDTFAVYSCIDCVNNGDIICGGYYAGGIIGRVQGNYNCYELNNEFYHIVHIEGCTNTGNITGLRAAEQNEFGTVQEATFVSQFLGFTDTAFNEIVDCKGYGTLTNTNDNYNVIFGIAANEYIPEEISAADILANATVSGIELIENDGTVNFTWSKDMGENGDRAGFRLTLAEYLAIEGNADKIIVVPEIPESGD